MMPKYANFTAESILQEIRVHGIPDLIIANFTKSRISHADRAFWLRQTAESRTRSAAFWFMIAGASMQQSGQQGPSGVGSPRTCGQAVSADLEWVHSGDRKTETQQVASGSGCSPRPSRSNHKEAESGKGFSPKTLH